MINFVNQQTIKVRRYIPISLIIVLFAGISLLVHTAMPHVHHDKSITVVLPWHSDEPCSESGHQHHHDACLISTILVSSNSDENEKIELAEANSGSSSDVIAKLISDFFCLENLYHYFVRQSVIKWYGFKALKVLSISASCNLLRAPPVSSFQSQ